MSIKKISICVWTTLFCLGVAGVVIAADFDHSMEFTSAEIDNISSMVSPMYAALNAADFDDSMKFTSAEIDAIPSMYADGNTTGFNDSMQFTRAEIDAIAHGNRTVICTKNC
jgi:hypothetical protein